MSTRPVKLVIRIEAVRISETTQTIARTFFDTLLNSAIEQLYRAHQKLSGATGGEPEELTQRINEALPENALPHVRNLLFSLAQEGKLGELPNVIQVLETHRSGTQALRAVVTSVQPLEDQQREQIRAALETRAGSTPLDLHFEVDESLIGGLVIRMGDEVFDNSLRTRLGVVQQSMLTS